MTRLWAPATGVRRDPAALSPRSPFAICSRFVKENRRSALLDHGIRRCASIDTAGCSGTRNRSMLDFRPCDIHIYTPESPGGRNQVLSHEHRRSERESKTCRTWHLLQQVMNNETLSLITSAAG